MRDTFQSRGVTRGTKITNSSQTWLFQNRTYYYGVRVVSGFGAFWQSHTALCAVSPQVRSILSMWLKKYIYFASFPFKWLFFYLGEIWTRVQIYANSTKTSMATCLSRKTVSKVLIQYNKYKVSLIVHSVVDKFKKMFLIVQRQGWMCRLWAAMINSLLPAG